MQPAGRIGGAVPANGVKIWLFGWDFFFRRALQNVVRMMSEKVGLRDPAEDGLNFSLHECRDGVTSESSVPACVH